uniref:Uncharacterized protein n=1 Tax=Grammatophora oceanica TaxID=210454 RepID=A0A7S1VDQ1_9STRA|mmetsp:Transcript_43951/g.65190  ORF Transcript_43951/g.65190 Transcript_43951/m.65190 type:complete len:230 (+) Transcript_43951:105-794(+)
MAGNCLKCSIALGVLCVVAVVVVLVVLNPFTSIGPTIGDAGGDLSSSSSGGGSTPCEQQITILYDYNASKTDGTYNPVGVRGPETASEILSDELQVCRSDEQDFGLGAWYSFQRNLGDLTLDEIEDATLSTAQAQQANNSLTILATASLCNDGTTSDANITVYQGGCNLVSLSCVPLVSETACENNSPGSVVQWEIVENYEEEAFENYVVLIHGISGNYEPSFTLEMQQ